MQKPLSEEELNAIIENCIEGDADNLFGMCLNLCRRVEEIHGIVEETPKEQSEKPIQLDMWL